MSNNFSMPKKPYLMQTVGLTLNLLYKDEKPSVCPSVCRHFFCTHVAQSFLHGSTPDLLEMKRPSLENTECLFKKLKSL